MAVHATADLYVGLRFLTDMLLSNEQEVVRVFWPFTIPSHAKFLITSPYPLKASHRCNLSFILTLGSPIHLSSPCPIDVIPWGVLSPGFARGWSRLPTELKLAILFHNLVVPFPIWPNNANNVMRDVLFRYLRMIPEIATLSRSLFFAENTFVVLPFREDLSMFRHLPPMLVRPLLRKIILPIWMEDQDRHSAEAIAGKSYGFQHLTHIVVQCSVVRFVKYFLLRRGIDASQGIEELVAQVKLQLPPLVHFSYQGRIEFSRAEVRYDRGHADSKQLELVKHVETLVEQRFKFTNNHPSILASKSNPTSEN